MELCGRERAGQCVVGEGGISVLEIRGLERQCEGLVLGERVAFACRDGVGYGGEEGHVGADLAGGRWRARIG